MLKKKITNLLIWLAIFILTSSGLFAQRSLQAKNQNWYLGFQTNYESRGIKAEAQKTTLSSPQGFLTFKVQNLGGTVDLAFYLGYGTTKLNGIMFNHLPISLDYQAGGRPGPVFGLKADWPVFSFKDLTLGLTADFFSYFGQKKKFNLEGFTEAGEAEVKPAWSQASSGLFLLYEGLDKVQPFVVLGTSFFWGDFKATEKIADLSGSESKKLKGSGFLKLSLGANITLVDHFSFIPQLTVYPASKTSLAGGIGILYSF